MLGRHFKWRFVLGLAMIVGGSFVAGCCGGPGNSGGGGCALCSARAALSGDEAGADAGADPGCAQADASSDAHSSDAADAGAD
jgi:hypothetical protein